jgi:hypothetical protein
MASKSGDTGRSSGVPDLECGGVGGLSLGEGSGNVAGRMALSTEVVWRGSLIRSELGGGGGGTEGGGGGAIEDSRGVDLAAVDAAVVGARVASDIFFGVAVCEVKTLSTGGGSPIRSLGEAKSIGPGGGR